MNDAYTISAENLLRALPEVLQNDSDMLALASGIAEQLAARLPEIDKVRLYTRIDDLPEDLLDILAYDFKVDWWDANYSLAAKRQIFKDSWAVHRSLGTKAAVERAISPIFKGTTVQEWFEYGGEPYHFKLRIDVTNDALDPAKHKRVFDRINFYKNLRSHLERIDYYAQGCFDAAEHMVCAVAERFQELFIEEASIELISREYEAGSGHERSSEYFTDNPTNERFVSAGYAAGGSLERIKEVFIG